MTSESRKIHVFIWAILIIIVPVLMYLAVKDKPIDLLYNSEQSNKSTNSFSELFTYSRIGSVLEISIKEPLQTASTVIYELNNGHRGELLGELDVVGNKYVFQISAKSEGFILYDIIKDKTIHKQIF